MSDHRTQATLQSIISELSTRIATLELQSAGLPVYTTATKPAASAVQAGTLIFVSDAGAGSQFQGSDGTTWRTLG
jgi:hypothetical protein